MDKSVIIVIAVVLAVIVGLPLVSSLMKSSEPANSADKAVPSGPAGSPTPAAVPLGAPPGAPGAPGMPGARVGAVPLAPTLDANSLVNTQWSMTISNIPVTVTFFNGGALQAQSPALRGMIGTDTVSGTWSVSGSNVQISATAGPQRVTETAVIRGNTLSVGGRPAQRLR